MRANAHAIVVTATLALGGSEAAQAQGLFDRLFRGMQPNPSYEMPAPPEPTIAPPPAAAAPGGPRRGGAAVCVRLCDGRFFPVQQTSGMNAAQLCTAFCPHTPTKVFSGGDIRSAVAADGTRYAGLPHAFAYRERIIANCSCNGIDSLGLANINPSADPGLRTGDLVSTPEGLAVFNGWNATKPGERASPSFSPVVRGGAARPEANAANQAGR
jgi:hypothetical protein